MAVAGRPVCVPSKTFFKPLKNGIYVEEGMPITLEDRVEWRPYKLYAADLYACAGCGAQIIYGIGAEPISEHYMPNYKDMVRMHPPLLRVEDC